MTYKGMHSDPEVNLSVQFISQFRRGMFITECTCIICKYRSIKERNEKEHNSQTLQQQANTLTGAITINYVDNNCKIDKDNKNGKWGGDPPWNGH